VKSAKDHTHFVQGVAWDPLGAFLATQSSDRTAKVWRLATKFNGTVTLTPFGKFARAPVSLYEGHQQHQVGLAGEAERMQSMFFDETMVTFFRRLAFSPDGSLLFLPAGLVPQSGEARSRHSFYLATRGQLSGLPGIVVDGSARGIIAIRPHPRLFMNRAHQISAPLFTLPYRIVYATASQDSVCIYDSTQIHPIAVFTGLHYGTITDVAWSCDGKHLLATATDGFASIVYIKDGELGEMMEVAEQEDIIRHLRSKYAPGAIPKAASQADPLDLVLTLNSELPIPPTSELDPASSHLPESPVVNILPVKRKVMPTPLAAPPHQPPDNNNMNVL